MITDKPAEAATRDIEDWAGRVIRSLDPTIGASVYHDPDSNTYVIRLARGNRVLLFRFSEAQVLTPERETECAEILRGKLRQL
jgi:hypothetical protein